MIIEEKAQKSETTNKKKILERPPTPLEVLKSQPKAMQVGPQHHLRKSFSKEVKNVK